jgi:hypothetical protein
MARNRVKRSNLQPVGARRVKVMSLMAFALLLAGCHRWENPGGQWYVRRTERLPEAGGDQAYLFRGRSFRRLPVLEFAYVYRYYGDDCIGYDSVAGVYFACGDRRPIELQVPGYPVLDDLEFGPNGAESQPFSESSGPPLLFPIVELKKRAYAQPSIESYQPIGPHELVTGTPRSR